MTPGSPVPQTIDRGAGTMGPDNGGRSPRVEVKQSAADGLGFSVVEYEVPAGFSPPPHLHRQTREHCSVYVLEGELRYWFEDGEAVARAGTLVQLPCDSWSRWANETAAPVRMLAIFCPAGFEQYFLDLGAAVAQADGDPAVLGEAIPRLRAQYGDESHPG